MNNYKKIFIIFFVFLGMVLARSTFAMTFSEYKIMLNKAGVTLTTRQEDQIKKYFEKNSKTNSTPKKYSSKQTDFADFNYILKKWTKDSETNGEVSKLQKVLKNNGIDVGVIDGYFGSQTEQAIEIFKSRNNVTNSPYGIFDPREFSNKNNSQKMRMFLASDEIYFYPLIRDDHIEQIICGGKNMPFFSKDNRVIIPLSFPYGNTKSFSCTYKADDRDYTFLDIIKKETPKETSYANIKVSEKYSNISTQEEKRIAKEKRLLSEVYVNNADEPIYFDAPFELPINSEMSSPFGKTRIINGEVSSYHSGTDFRAQVPTDVYAVNRGEVIFTHNDLFYCGKTIVINHGMNIFTAYCHLSDINVNIDDIVESGDIIGKTGATGRVSGPHLHISQKFNGNYMDFMRVYENSKNLI